MTERRDIQWWDAARFTSSLAISELQVPDPLIAHLQEGTRALLAEVETQMHWNVRLPHGGEVIALHAPGVLPEFRLNWFAPSNGWHRGIDLVAADCLHPLGAQRLTALGWPHSWGAAIPWLQRPDGVLEDPMTEDVAELVGVLQWLRYRASVGSSDRRHVA